RRACVHRAAAWACVSGRNVAKAAELCLGHLEPETINLLLVQGMTGPLVEELAQAAREKQVAIRFGEARQCLRSYQRKLLLDIVGDPFRPVRFDPCWRTPEAIEMARAIYHERAFDQLPYLWDALEEAGCADPRVRQHLIEPGIHVRGCWLVDLLLAK